MPVLLKKNALLKNAVWLLLLLSACATPSPPDTKPEAEKHTVTTEDIDDYTPCGLPRLLDSLIDHSALVVDTGWWQHLNYTEQDLYPFYGPPEQMPPFVELPPTDIKLWYFPDGHFQLGNHAFPPDTVSNWYRAVFGLRSLRRFSFMGRKFTTFTSHLYMYNGYGDRITFNYFFSDNPPVQDIYENATLCLYTPFVYGNLNGDTLLDRLVYDGFIYPNPESDTNWVNVRAQTFRSNKWQPLKDASGKEYFIELRTNWAMDSCTVTKAYWMNKIP